MAINKPPYDATVENIRMLCEECRDVSKSGDEELEEIVDDLEGSTFNRNLEAAVLLGFFEEDENGKYTPTKRGKMIGYGPDEGQETDIFREIIRENEFYNELLEIVGNELDESGEKRYLTRDKVMRQIGINFDFGVGDRTIESASGVFLKVLDAAGLGTYKRGQGSYPTRLEINDEYTGFVESISADGKSGDPDNSEEEKDDSAKQTELSQIDEDIDGAMNGESKNGNSEQSEPSESVEEVVEKEIVDTPAGESIEVQVNIEVSSTDWESEEVIKFIEAIQSE
ncbi:hypothetical protein KTS45_10390 [Halomicroarcula limicola]|uniref:Uncharacterized protein n=1 Tax=Haloarcula limicola TaxID=1429915 RepID=A0A8J7YC93_9EURY|nr:hypothetical protein [Halomicroarcula limicola]MBV0924606.1 hypothetical protein [Halomicroarcula limicola]